MHLFFEFVYIIKYDTHILVKIWFSGIKYNIICQNAIWLLIKVTEWNYRKKAKKVKRTKRAEI